MTLNTEQKRPRPQHAKLLLGIALAALILLGGALGATGLANREHLRQRAEASAAQLAVAITAYARQLEFQAQRLGAETTITDALGSGDPSLITDLQQSSLRLVPGADSLQLLALPALGIADPQFDPSLLRNNIEVHLAGSAFKGETTHAEAYAYNKRWLLTAAAPVRANGQEQVLGILLLRADLQAILQQYIAPAAMDGEYSLWSAAAGEDPRELTHYGQASGDISVYRFGTGLGTLQAGFRPSQAFLDGGGSGSVPMLILILLVCSALALLATVLTRQAQARLKADVTALIALTGKRKPPGGHTPRELSHQELTPLQDCLDNLDRGDSAQAQEKPRKVPAKVVPDTVEDRNPLDIREAVEETPPVAQTSADPVPLQEEVDQLFRDYDIRGEAELLTRDLVFAIGQAIGSEAIDRNCRTLAVGADGRESSPRLREQLVRGLLSTGVEVTDVGTVATPMLYFAVHKLQLGGGVMITGSHNPASQNGFKIMIDGETLCGERIRDLRQRIRNQHFHAGEGNYRVAEINADYIKAICDDVLIDGKLKVVIDCGNGAAAVVAEDLFHELGCELTPMFCDLDGSFPNHDPDPSVPGNLRKLMAEVSSQRADLGIAFDGDGDRIGVVSTGGRIVAADRLMMLFAHDVLSRNPGSDIVFDVKCSSELSTLVMQHGGRPIMCRSGHSWIKEKMKETGALLGGEFTGHICFRDRWFGFDDALYAAARLLEILTAEACSLDELMARLPQTIATPEIRVDVEEGHKFEWMNKLAEGIDLPGARLIRLDGVRAEFADGWGLVRASNTSAALILRFEARNEEALNTIEAAFRAELTRLLPANIKLPF